MVGIEALTTRGAKCLSCRFEASAALHSEAKRKISVAKNMFGECQAGLWVFR